MKIEVGKFYKTRDGRKVRIYALDGYSDKTPIHGAVLKSIGWVFEEWHQGGTFNSSGNSYSDIVSEWEEPKSGIVPPGEYILSFPNGSEIHLEKVDYQKVKDGEQDFENYVKTSAYGYFEGNYIEDVRFIGADYNSIRAMRQLGKTSRYLEYAMINGSSIMKVEWDETSGVLSVMCNCGGKIDTHKPTCPENKEAIALPNPMGYPYGYMDELPPQAMKRVSKKCECGSDFLGSSKHSDYCPKFEES